MISHWNLQPVIDRFGSVQGRDLGAVADDVTRIVDGGVKDLPKGSRRRTPIRPTAPCRGGWSVHSDRLRVRIQVPQAYSREAVPGVEADLTLPEFAGRRFRARLVRTAQSIDPLTRIMRAEVEVVSGLEAADAVILNPSDSLMAGVQVRVVKPAAEQPQK